MKLLIKEFLVKFDNEGQINSREFNGNEYFIEGQFKDKDGEWSEELYRKFGLSEIFDEEGSEEGFNLGVLRLNIDDEELVEYEFKEVI